MAVVPALLDSVGVDSRAMGAAKTILIHNDKSLLRQWLCIYRLLPHRLYVAAALGRMLLLLVPDGELWVDVSYDSYMFPFLFSVGPLFSISFPFFISVHPFLSFFQNSSRETIHMYTVRIYVPIHFRESYVSIPLHPLPPCTSYRSLLYQG